MQRSGPKECKSQAFRASFRGLHSCTSAPGRTRQWEEKRGSWCLDQACCCGGLRRHPGDASRLWGGWPVQSWVLGKEAAWNNWLGSKLSSSRERTVERESFYECQQQETFGVQETKPSDWYWCVRVCTHGAPHMPMQGRVARGQAAESSRAQPCALTSWDPVMSPAPEVRAAVERSNPTPRSGGCVGAEGPRGATLVQGQEGWP